MIRVCIFAVIAVALSGCSNLSGLQEGYNEWSTSRTVGHWKGTQRCIEESYGAIQSVEMKLVKGDMPLTSYGMVLIERRLDQNTLARAWVQVRAESAVGGKAIMTGTQVLKTQGPLRWVTTTWPGAFLDDNTMELTACGAPLVLKRQAEGTPSSI
ncbi:hypothetical protein [Pseudomonas sp. 2FG]|uniref:hypothetical protein n=1 Tax=Pseudomonas sp. 2FG TaxID=2502191 RepID=UPI0010F70A98|nr:hypothetical protein [Pseudomonas sp. 2FG]